MIKNFEALKARVQNKIKKTVAVVEAGDLHTLEAVLGLQAYSSIKTEWVFIGNEPKIRELAKEIGLDLSQGSIIATQSEEEAAQMAVSLAKADKVDVLFKGKIQTGTLLKAVVNKETGINTGGLMSHLAAIESPHYDRILYITDGGMNPHPDLAQKQQIIHNAVSHLKGLGYEKPAVAVLTAVESVSEKMPETVDAQSLQMLNQQGGIADCTVYGPVSFDLAISKESAAIKGVNIPHAGEMDVFVVPDITTGNVLGKALLYLGKAKMAGCIIGAKTPIILTSRGASAEEKFLSFLLALATV